MLQELRDGHVELVPRFQEEDVICGPPYHCRLWEVFNSPNKVQQFEATVDSELLSHGFSNPIKRKLSKHTNFQYRVSDSFGYLRLDEMTEKWTFGGFNRALNKALRAFANKQGVIFPKRKRTLRELELLQILKL